MLRLTTGSGDRALVLDARLERERAPRTAETVVSLLPFRGKILPGRWSGESAWIPLDELLLPYGPTIFESRVGRLASNHFATVTNGRESLRELGRRVLWEGAQDVLIELRGEG